MPNIFCGNKQKRKHRPDPSESWTSRGPHKQFHNPYNFKYDKNSTRSCLDILKGHRQAVKFRELNQSMCAQESTENQSLFTSSPALFEEYHSGYDHQRAQWKADPLDAIVAAIPEIQQKHAKALEKKKTKKPESEPGTVLTVEIGDRKENLSTDNFIVADFGCGTGKLVEGIFPKISEEQVFEDKETPENIGTIQCGEKALKCYHTTEMTVLSFDLVAVKPFITETDITKVPLPDNSVSLVVLCLSLIGGNFVDVLLEAYRVLTPKTGRIVIAEVASRFRSARARSLFRELMTSIGFDAVKLQPELNASPASEEAEDDQAEDPLENSYFLYCTGVKRADFYRVADWKKTLGKRRDSLSETHKRMHAKFAKIKSADEAKAVRLRREWHKTYILQKFHPEKIIAPYRAKRRFAPEKKQEEENAEENAGKKRVWKHRNCTSSTKPKKHASGKGAKRPRRK